MKTTRIAILLVAMLTMMGACKTQKSEQAPAMKMTTPIPESITTVDDVKTSIGTLDFFDGVPTKDTVEKVYDYLDRSRAVEVFINMMPAVSMYQLRQGQRDVGAKESNQICIWEDLMDSKSLVLTGNNTSLYTWGFLDLKKDGPMVIELPPDVLGILDDMYFRYIADMGAAGPDKGKGGKYLVLPPDYKGDVPDGYFVVRSKTYGVWNMMRGYVRDSVKDAADSIKNTLKVYPLAKKDNPPKMEFINMTGKEGYNTVPPSDVSFYGELNKVIQEEPLEFLDPETRGLIASIGIVKGKPFEPDARMHKILVDAAAIGDAYARANTVYPRDAGQRIYSPDSEWVMAFPDKDTFFLKDGARRADGRLWMHFNAIAVTPAMALTKPGAGSDYAIAGLDSKHQPLDGAKTYKLHLPPDVPVKDNWSVTIYDTQTRCMLQTDQPYAGINSLGKGLKKNADGSFDIYFAPTAPKGEENNWIQTIPGKSWFIILRAYGPLEPWINKTWRPGEIELDASNASSGSSAAERATPPKMKMTASIPENITTVDEVKTSIGTLDFFDGVPTKDTVEKVYDYVDRARAVQVFLNTIPAMSMFSLRQGQASVGADASNKVCIWDTLMDSTTVLLTGNTSTMYAVGFLDLDKDGPTVIDLPPKMLGILDDAAFHYMSDLGVAGPDKGAGGKFLVLPPDYKGDVPEGYFTVKSKTNSVWLFMRGYLDKGVKAASENIRNNLKVYPLKKKDGAPEMVFINVSGKEMNTVLPNDYSFFEKLHALIQQEPDSFLGPEIKGQMAAIGIIKGKPFKPDARMKKILGDAAEIGNAAARAISYFPRDPGNFTYNKDSAWVMAYANKDTTFTKDGARNLDARVLFHFGYICVSPAMAVTVAGKGSDYAMAMSDSNGQTLDGSKTYKLHLPPNIPVKDFWAVTMYDTQTRSQLQTDQQFPTLDSYREGLKKNAEGSIDIYFASKPPKGEENNWLQTIPGKSWFIALRMYGPLQPWIDQTWRPGEIELVK